MKAELFRSFADIAYQYAGISLGDGKESLVSARVGRRQRALNIASPEEYLDYLHQDQSGTELRQFLDAITTNFTSFFREPVHFTLLRSALQQLIDQGARQIRLWSAASSTGEEPYTIAMTALEALKDRPVDLRILATDISSQALNVARAGWYAKDKIAGIPPELLQKYFEPTQVDGEPGYRAKPRLCAPITFAKCNLARPPLPMKGPFDFIFCRNVMIYFNTEVKAGLVIELERLLAQAGLLVIGHSESLHGIMGGLQMIKPSIFKKGRRL